MIIMEYMKKTSDIGGWIVGIGFMVLLMGLIQSADIVLAVVLSAILAVFSIIWAILTSVIFWLILIFLVMSFIVLILLKR
jgi:hypothetical protein